MQIQNSSTKYPRMSLGYENDQGYWTADTGGTGVVTYVTDTTLTIPTGGSMAFSYVQCLTDTVFESFTRQNSTGSIVGLELPAGTVLVGPITSLKLTSGAVAAYD
jgi:hypothetical protein